MTDFDDKVQTLYYHYKEKFYKANGYYEERRVIDELMQELKEVDK